MNNILVIIITLMVPTIVLGEAIPQATSSQINALKAGTMSPGVQMSMHATILAQCTAIAQSMGAEKFDSYLTARKKFGEAACYMARCFNYSLGLDFIAQSGPNPVNNGGITSTSIQQANYQIGVDLINEANKQSCSQTGSSS